MVFLSVVNFIGKSGRDITLRRHRYYRMSGNFYGRRRNCFSLALRAVQKALQHATLSRKVIPGYVSQLRITRLQAACAEHGTDYTILTRNLNKCGLRLHNRTLCEFAVWEPRTFKSLIDLSMMKNKLDAPDHIDKFVEAPTNVITRGML